MTRKAKTSGANGPSAAQVGRDAGCSRVLAARLLKRGFTPAQIVERVAERKRREAAKRSAPLNGHAADALAGYPSFAASQAKKEFHLARLRELQADAVARAMISRTEAKTWLTHVLVPLSHALRRLPGEVAPELENQPVAEVERALSLRIEAILQCAREYWHGLKLSHGAGDGSLEIGGYLVTWTIERAPKKAA
jgi:hypothetical protein